MPSADGDGGRGACYCSALVVNPCRSQYLIRLVVGPVSPVPFDGLLLRCFFNTSQTYSRAVTVEQLTKMCSSNAGLPQGRRHEDASNGSSVHPPPPVRIRRQGALAPRMSSRRVAGMPRRPSV